MPKYKIQVGRDASVYFSTTVEADSLEEAQGRLSKNGYAGDTDAPWVFDGYDSFDNVETASLTAPDGSISEYDAQTGWEE